MTREEAKKNLISIGIDEPTNDQITNYLNQVNGESKKNNDKYDKIKAELDEAKAKADKFDEIEKEKMSDIERLNAELDKSNSRVAELEKISAIREQRVNACEKFKITTEESMEVVKDDGTIDFDKLGQIISDKESKASIAKEQEIAKGQTSPGSKPGSDSETKTDAEKLVGSLFSDNDNTNNNILSNYL